MLIALRPEQLKCVFYNNWNLPERKHCSRKNDGLVCIPGVRSVDLGARIEADYVECLRGHNSNSNPTKKLEIIPKRSQISPHVQKSNIKSFPRHTFAAHKTTEIKKRHSHRWFFATPTDVPQVAQTPSDMQECGSKRDGLRV